MFVAPGQLLDRVDMLTALVRKGSRTDPRQPGIVPNIGDFINELRKLL